MKTGEFGVVLQKQGQRPNLVVVGSGATVRSALKAAKITPESVEGRLTHNKGKADLNARLKTNDLLVISEPVTGGSR